MNCCDDSLIIFFLVHRNYINLMMTRIRPLSGHAFRHAAATYFIAKPALKTTEGPVSKKTASITSDSAETATWLNPALLQASCMKPEKVANNRVTSVFKASQHSRDRPLLEIDAPSLSTTGQEILPPLINPDNITHSYAKSWKTNLAPPSTLLVIYDCIPTRKTLSSPLKSCALPVPYGVQCWILRVPGPSKRQTLTICWKMIPMPS